VDGDQDVALERVRRRQQAADAAFERRAAFERHMRWSGRTSGLAIASFVTALMGFSLVGIVLGHVALAQIPRRAEKGAGFAVAGLVVGYVGLLAQAAVLIAFLVRF